MHPRSGGTQLREWFLVGNQFSADKICKCMQATLLSELLHQALKRVQELDSEIGTTMSQIFERQKYNTAVETLFDEEADKGKKMSETLRSMEIHEAEQVRLVDAITDHLDSRGISTT
jgi:hypothetical protein